MKDDVFWRITGENPQAARSHAKSIGGTLALTLEAETEELLAGEYGKVSINLRSLDPKLMELMGQVHRLALPDREALRRILEAMLTRTKIQEAMAG